MTHAMHRRRILFLVQLSTLCILAEFLPGICSTATAIRNGGEGKSGGTFIDELVRKGDSKWECGKPPTLGLKPIAQPFIINGTRVQRGEIPWMVAITKFQHNKRPQWRVVCGGALLNERYVLTASHCLDGRYKDTLEVVFNLDHASKVTSDPEVIRMKIKRFLMHPNYSKKTVDNDIALIEMKQPLNISTIGDMVWPICLPQSKQDFSHEMATVSGWGFTDYDKNKATALGNLSSHLQRVYVPILHRNECLRTKLPPKNNITENMICAGFVEEGGKDSCLNDSGGPLTVFKNGRHYVAGIVSWGIGCGLKGYPGVYTKVSNYMTWITEQMKSAHRN